MHFVLHLIPLIAALIAFFLLTESMRAGVISIAQSMSVIGGVYLLGYVLTMVAVCIATGVPLSQFLKQITNQKIRREK